MWDIICSTPSLEVCGLASATQKKIQAFAKMIWEFYEIGQKVDAHTLMVEIANKSGIMAELTLHKDDPENKDRLANIYELLDGVNGYVKQQTEAGEPTSMDTYLQEISLMTNEDKADQDKSVTDFVSLMTVHASKGLEFNNIVIAGMEDEKFPGTQCSAQDLEEERRLLYVAITRARKSVKIHYAHRIVVFGQFKDGHPSRFLKDIDDEYIDKSITRSTSFRVPSGFRKPDFLERPAASTPKPSFSPTTSTRLPAGNFRPAPKPSASPASGAPCMFAVDDRVVHDTFGRGTVLEVNGSGLDSKLLVKFDNGQTKHLLLKFARLRKIQ